MDNFDISIYHRKLQHRGLYVKEEDTPDSSKVMLRNDDTLNSPQSSCSHSVVHQ